MDAILKWAAQYSAPVVILLACGAALIFVFQNVVEKVVETEFDKRNKRLELLLQRRSNFEEKVILDQYETVTKLQMKLANISADLNRLHSGIDMQGLMKGKDIVPLSEVYIDLQAKRFLLKEEFYELLKKEADTLLAFAKAKTPDELSTLSSEFLKLNELFREQMDRAFGIEQISWTKVGSVDR